MTNNNIKMEFLTSDGLSLNPYSTPTNDPNEALVVVFKNGGKIVNAEIKPLGKGSFDLSFPNEASVKDRKKYCKEFVKAKQAFAEKEAKAFARRDPYFDYRGIQK